MVSHHCRWLTRLYFDENGLTRTGIGAVDIMKLKGAGLWTVAVRDTLKLTKILPDK